MMLTFKIVCILLLTYAYAAPPTNSTAEEGGTQTSVAATENEKGECKPPQNKVTSREAMVVDLAMKLNEFSPNMTEDEKDFLDDMLSKDCDEDKELATTRTKRGAPCCAYCRRGHCCGGRKCYCTWLFSRPKCES